MSTPHPNLSDGDEGRLRRMMNTIRRRREAKLSAYAKALFLDDKGDVRFEAQRLLADLRKQSKLFGSSISRDRHWKIDTDEMLRIEGRREIVLRLMNLLELGPQEVAQYVEVDDGRN